DAQAVLARRVHPRRRSERALRGVRAAAALAGAAARGALCRPGGRGRSGAGGGGSLTEAMRGEQAAGGRHDDFHHHVAPRPRARRSQSRTGLSRLRHRSTAHRARGRGHERRAQPVRPHGGPAGAARAHRRQLLAVYGLSVDAESEITITLGATEAIFSAVEAGIGAGDEAIAFDPAYHFYEPAVP